MLLDWLFVQVIVNCLFFEKKNYKVNNKCVSTKTDDVNLRAQVKNNERTKKNSTFFFKKNISFFKVSIVIRRILTELSAIACCS